jgi:hypothetical protein
VVAVKVVFREESGEMIGMIAAVSFVFLGFLIASLIAIFRRVEI